jgi:3-hydroxyacyl-CoA dehydrogenase / 3-hydroxy-2-methylbutyryl-CoA dehydrogenase
VTGAASGLGEASARSLAKSGASVAIFDIPGSSGPEVADELGRGVVFVGVDLTDDDSVVVAIDEVSERFGRIDVLVNAAGIATRGRIISRSRRLHSLEEFRRVLDVNVIGTWNMARLAAEVMSRNEPCEEGERGVIINVASIAGLEGEAAQTAYAASKAAIAGLTLPLARDLAYWGVRVNTIAPGLFDTPILNEIPADELAAMTSSTLFPKRPGHPDEFARLVLFLVENPMLNGEIIRIDAGARLGPGR